ncbi:hypothetical protein FSARC_13919 [Fusarium sarcochroum]|uniref:C2H2-type domain-containing protein n=1 Tax=Fusarium sarcochroum TaxID=1208366 RepID=A0A8H4WR11_9HYPO|nr:hypothetical protein FSARC_13919 [Fusarium sarcochroum]
MDYAHYYDPDEVVPRNSPLLRPSHVRLEPDTLDVSDEEETDLEDVIEPWNPALRDKKRQRTIDSERKDKQRKKNKNSLSNWKDAFLVHQMSPRYGWELATSEFNNPLPPDQTVTETPPSSFSRKRRRKRNVLPLFVSDPKILTQSTHIRVEACPDSGSEENIISLELVNQLKLEVIGIAAGVKEFSLPNGKIVQPVGCVILACVFAAGTPPPTPCVESTFYVFNTLAVPMIMGMEFLLGTETLNKHTDRLVEQVIPSMQNLRVNSVGRPKRNIVCRLNDLIGHAAVDTGSDLNFVHPRVIPQGTFTVAPAYEYLEFADGSLGLTSGVFQPTFSIGCNDDLKEFQSVTELMSPEFYVLDNLNTDILIGQDTTDDLEVLTAHLRSVVHISEADAACNIIRHRGKIEQCVRKGFEKVKDIFSSSRMESNTTIEQEALVKLELQRENAKQEHKRAVPSGPVGPLPPLTPQAPTIRSNEGNVSTEDIPTGSQRLPSLRSTFEEIRGLSPESTVVELSDSDSGVHKCQYYGCNAAPFQTQYLLNSHMNIHSSARPHYCPVGGCPRSEGGRGFKRRNEMIRHSLVHDSPGPDNLARHVLLDHIDVDRNDPIFLDVLAQRPDGPNRGRRRRGPPS